MKLFDELVARGLIHQVSEHDEVPFPTLLESGPQGVYAGFDPTADSLHIGSLVPLVIGQILKSPAVRAALPSRLLPAAAARQAPRSRSG